MASVRGRGGTKHTRHNAPASPAAHEETLKGRPTRPTCVVNRPTTRLISPLGSLYVPARSGRTRRLRPGPRLSLGRRLGHQTRAWRTANRARPALAGLRGPATASAIGHRTGWARIFVLGAPIMLPGRSSSDPAPLLRPESPRDHVHVLSTSRQLSKAGIFFNKNMTAANTNNNSTYNIRAAN